MDSRLLVINKGRKFIPLWVDINENIANLIKAAFKIMLKTNQAKPPLPLTFYEAQPPVACWQPLEACLAY